MTVFDKEIQQKRWTGAELERVRTSNESDLAIAQALGRTEQAVHCVRDRFKRKGIMTQNALRMAVHRILKRHSEEIMDEIDAVYGIFSSDCGYLKRRKSPSKQF